MFSRCKCVYFPSLYMLCLLLRMFFDMTPVSASVIHHRRVSCLFCLALCFSLSFSLVEHVKCSLYASRSRFARLAHCLFALSVLSAILFFRLLFVSRMEHVKCSPLRIAPTVKSLCLASCCLFLFLHYRCFLGTCAFCCLYAYCRSRRTWYRRSGAHKWS